MGGYTTGRKEIVELLRQRSRPYLFSNTLPPAVVGATSKTFDLLLKDASLPRKVGLCGRQSAHRSSPNQAW